MEDLLGIKNINSHSEQSEESLTTTFCKGSFGNFPQDDRGKCITPSEFLSSQSSLRNSTLPVQGGRFAKAGFTLAEVLITLGIIGVVAAMTIPNLIANVNGHKFRSQFKKSLSSVNQAVRLNIANYDYNFASVNTNCVDAPTDHPEITMSICALFNGSLKGSTISDYTKLKDAKGNLYYSELYDNGTTSDTLIKEQHINLYYYQMADGALFAFHAPFEASSTDTACTLGNKSFEQAMNDANFQKYCIAWLDVNGVSLPNKEVRCSDGKSHSKDIDTKCVVPNSVKHMGDVFPIALYDDTAAPASAAARYVLNTAK